MEIVIQLIGKIFNRLWKMLYWPICRTYACYIVGDSPADALLRGLFSLQFWRDHRYWPNFVHPRYFSEMVASRMLNERDPRWTMLSDKLHVRDYVAGKVGREYLIPLLWSGDNPEEIPFDELPLKFVIKTNHGCGYNIIVKDKTQLDRTQTRRQLKKWLGENFCHAKCLGTAWAYKNIKPKIMIEAFLNDNGKTPLDYKFFCFSGRAEFLLMTFDRYGDLSEKHFDRDFNPLDLWNGSEQYTGEIARPDNYEEMVHFAETLAQGMDFIRVDIYNVDSRIYFGELTCYPAGSLARFIPREYDYIFGKKWKWK